MQAKLFLLLILVPLLVPVPALSQSFQAAQPASFGLGYGPLSIEPITVGTPVYTPGDQLWVQSYQNTTSQEVFLTSPAGVTTPGIFLEPGALVSILTFTPSDPLGQWTVTVTVLATGASSKATVTLASPTVSLVPRLVKSNLSENTLNLDYSIPPTTAYNIQGCLMGTLSGPSATFQLPAATGGSMKVILIGNSLTVTPSGSASQFNAWFDLYTQRSYDEYGTLVSKLTLAAQTGVLSISPSPQQNNASFNDYLNLGGGRYELQAYVRTQAGLQLFDAQFLKTNGASWVSLQGCTQLADAASSTLAMSANLDNSNSTWPRSLITMFDVGGVEAYNVSGIPFAEARIDIRSESQAKAITGVVATATGQGIESWDSFDGSIFLTGTRFPMSISVGINYGPTSRTYNSTVQSPYSSLELLVPVGTLDIHVAAGSAAADNATLSVSEAGPQQAYYHADKEGDLSVMLPPGTYQINASYDGRSASAGATLVPGETTQVGVQVGSQPFPIMYIALVGVLVIAIGINYVVWRQYQERRSAFRQPNVKAAAAPSRGGMDAAAILRSGGLERAVRSLSGGFGGEPSTP
ncbi:MAG: hypothetical protein JRN18_00165 [Nitrososphaerota archaeon]|jgi:hypothetical protein|nr:hypothetical protein [Nitrososphaerota archaeon]MDG6947700.1 hypothetical protein [Nitrososphaerota archaeon]